jgi:hypothetical protein
MTELSQTRSVVVLFAVAGFLVAFAWIALAFLSLGISLANPWLYWVYRLSFPGSLLAPESVSGRAIGFYLAFTTFANAVIYAVVAFLLCQIAKPLRRLRDRSY